MDSIIQSLSNNLKISIEERKDELKAIGTVSTNIFNSSNKIKSNLNENQLKNISTIIKSPSYSCLSHFNDNQIKRKKTFEYASINNNFKVNFSCSNLSNIILTKSQNKIRKTKIICTIGPSSSSTKILGDLIDAGMNVARFNFSHGEHHVHQDTLNNLQKAIKERPHSQCALLMDTKGPEIRTGSLIHHKPILFKSGDLLKITSNINHIGTNEKISCNYPYLSTSVQIGSIILCDDGSITMEVLKIHINDTNNDELQKDVILVKIKNNCILEEHKNMHFPGVKNLKVIGLTEKDIYDIKNFAIPNKVDIISGSFIRSAQDIRAIRNCLGEERRKTRIHAKIENIQALNNIDEIINEADGIHISRGDLGMELSPEQVFLAQKMIIEKANIAGKPVVTSTQMLQSMTMNDSPTFAECSDVANAVIDGTDAVMLSAETAKGKYPKEAVQIMSKICIEAEEGIASAAVEVSIDLKAKLIVCFSETGYSARLIAKYRPESLILVVTASSCTSRQMEGLSRGVYSLLALSNIEKEDLITYSIQYAKNKNWIDNGDIVIIIHGQLDGFSGNTNILKVVEARSNGYISSTNYQIN